MVVLKTSRELKAMREAGRISANALKLAGEAVEPGITTWEIDEIVRDAKMRNVEAFVFATNTLAANGLTAIFRNGWRVPQDFAMACFDSNEAFDIYKTAVAYVRQPIEQFGTEALDLLIKNIEQKDQPINSIRIVLTPEIVESGIPGRETEISQLIEE